MTDASTGATIDLLNRERSKRAEILRRRAEELARPLVGPSAAPRRAVLPFQRAERFAVPAEVVVEVRPLGGVEAIPGLPAVVAGVAAVRGRVVAILDLAPDRAPAEGTGRQVIVLEVGDLEAGLVAEAVGHVVEVEDARFGPLPTPSPPWLAALGFDPAIGTILDPGGLLRAVGALVRRVD